MMGSHMAMQQQLIMLLLQQIASQEVQSRWASGDPAAVRLSEPHQATETALAPVHFRPAHHSLNMGLDSRVRVLQQALCQYQQGLCQRGHPGYQGSRQGQAVRS